MTSCLRALRSGGGERTARIVRITGEYGLEASGLHRLARNRKRPKTVCGGTGRSRRRLRKSDVTSDARHPSEPAGKSAATGLTTAALRVVARVGVCRRVVGGGGRGLQDDVDH